MVNVKTQYVPWVEKYRPTLFDEVEHHEKNIQIFQKFIEEDNIPHMLFYGPPGTGKTTLILSVAKKLYGNQMKSMVLHLNASDDRGVEVIRKEVTQFASSANLSQMNRCKMIILDEADSMTNGAQVALQDILRKYSHNVRVCLIGNYQYSLIRSLLSRIMRFLFTPIPLEASFNVARRILDQEGITFSEGGLRSVYALTGGDMRKFINSLQAMSLRTNNIDEESTRQILSHWNKDEIVNFVGTLKTEPIQKCFYTISDRIEHHSHDFLSWIKIVNDYYLERLDEKYLIDFCERCADIEYNSSFVTNYRIQIFSFVCLCHH
jgi:replication factor C subunit 3/5